MDDLSTNERKVLAGQFCSALGQSFPEWQRDAERATERRLEARHLNALLNEEEMLP